MDLTSAKQVDVFGDYKLFAVLIPPMAVFTIPRLFVFAVPDDDGRYSIVGQLTVPTVAPSFDGVQADLLVEWVEVDPEHRRKSIARRLWMAAEKVLGRRVVGEGVTAEGEAFVEAMNR
jgi:ribosomal protein S18 acetylase RimI-like enzyme